MIRNTQLATSRLIIITTSLLLLTACAGGRDPGFLHPPPQTGAPANGTATVDSIDILILESFPVQVNVVVKGTLPSSCSEIDQVKTSRDIANKSFVVEITTTTPQDKVCAMSLTAFEKTIPLDVYGLPAGSYTVDVNGVTGTFVLATDNSLTKAAPQP